MFNDEGQVRLLCIIMNYMQHYKLQEVTNYNLKQF